MGELKSCPFCGATPIIERRDVEPQGDPWYGDKVVRFVLCECGVSLFDRYFHEGFDSNEEAIAAWNHRAPDGQRDTARGVPPRRDGKKDRYDVDRAYTQGWNACIDAMLAAAPTPPDGDAGRDRRDAERYRHVRAHGMPKLCPAGFYYHDGVFYPTADAAIDAYVAASKGEGGA